MRSAAILILMFFAGVLAISGTALLSMGDAPSVAYKVIVNPTNPSTILDRKFVEDAFLKKVSMWSSGTAIHPVDLLASSPLRRRFTEDVLARSISAVRAYWQQRIFSGHGLPPPELERDDDVVRYVLKYDGAVGYVSGNAQIAECRVVAIAR